ncbi:MAG: hypothetical protein QOI59_1045 [Gammaproteobacteria bacterium]|jgi:hypothetical protein|nr:hypothetical protein [Gammaproteobacteria bacterium]
MRVLVAGRNAKVLAKAAGTFANDLQIHTAATKAACLALLQRAEFDLIVACETLGDGSGLEVLSHVAVNTPNTLRIFAARPATLNLLKGELGLFGLFRTLPYPISFRKLWAAVNLARSTCAEVPPPKVVATSTGGVKHVVLEDEWNPSQRTATPAQQAPARAAARPTSASIAPTAPARRTAAAPVNAGRQPPPAPRQRPTAQPQQARQQQPATQRQQAPLQQQQVTSGMRAAARYAAAHAAPPQHAIAGAQSAPRAVTTGATRQAPSPQRSAAGATRQAPTQRQPAAPTRQAPPSQRQAASARRPPAPIPQSDAFKRALAKRNAAKLEANSNFGPTDPTQAPPQFNGANNRGRRRREPGMTNDSLAQLAKLAATGRSTYNPRGAPAGKKRAAFFVGSGVFAATTAAVLTFFMMNANNSIERSKLPMIASINRPGPNNVFPWQPETQQPTRQTTFMRSESTAPAAADLEVEAEAASENFEVEPGHPGPPQPNAPPPPSEPPSLEAPAQWVDE